MERPHHSVRAVSELSQTFDVKQAVATGRPHSPVVLHSLPATRPSASRGSTVPYAQRPVTTSSTPRLPHQRHGHHSSDPFAYQHQYAMPTTHGTSHGTAYTHHVTSRARPVPIGNRDIIVGPAEERSPTAGAASKLFLSMKRTLSLKKAQSVRLLYPLWLRVYFARFPMLSRFNSLARHLRRLCMNSRAQDHPHRRKSTRLPQAQNHLCHSSVEQRPGLHACLSPLLQRSRRSRRPIP